MSSNSRSGQHASYQVIALSMMEPMQPGLKSLPSAKTEETAGFDNKAQRTPGSWKLTDLCVLISHCYQEILLVLSNAVTVERMSLPC